MRPLDSGKQLVDNGPMSYGSIVEFWSEFQATDRTHIHPQDEPTLGGSSKWLAETHGTFEAYAQSSSFGERSAKLHCSLLPLPFIGDLDAAKIFILLLNPGLSPSDYHELANEGFRARVLDNLRGDNAKHAFPFLFLDPRFCWHAGFTWWEAKLRDIAVALHKQRGGTYRDALCALSEQVAAIELFPYHSTTSPSSAKLRKLPSVLAMQQFVQTTLVERARQGKALIIVTRQVREWNIPDDVPNVVRYAGTEARSAHLSGNSTGSKNLRRWLELDKGTLEGLSR